MPKGSRKAEVEVGARSRKLDSGLRRAREKLKSFGKKSSRDLKKSFRGVGQSLKTMVGFGGAATFALAARNVMNFEKTLTRLKIQSGSTIDRIAKLRSGIRTLSDASGASSDEILEGVRGYVSMTGSLDGATEAMETFTKVSVASGATMADIVKTAAGLQKTMDIDPSEFEQAFSILLRAGKQGSIELKDVAQVLGQVSPQFKKFGEEGEAGLRRLGAAFQVVAPEFNFNASEAMTGMRRFMTAMMKSAPRIKELLEVNVYKKGTNDLKTLRQIVEELDASKKTQNDTLVTQALGSIEAFRTFGALRDNRQMWDNIYKSSRNATDVAEDYATFQESSAGKMARSWERMKNTIARAITPGRIEKFARGMEKVADAVGFIANHLEIAVGLLAAAKLSPALLTLIGWKGMGGGAGGGAGGTKAGLVGAAGVGGFALGNYLEKRFGISDRLLGVDTDWEGLTKPERLRKSAELLRQDAPSAGYVSLVQQQGALGGMGGMLGGASKERVQELTELRTSALASAARLDEEARRMEGRAIALEAAAKANAALIAKGIATAEEIRVQVDVKLDGRDVGQTQVKAMRQGD